MGQSAATQRKGDDVKRQVDSDVSNQRPIYQLVDVKTGGGKLIDLVKLSVNRRTSLMNSSTSSSGAGSMSFSAGQSKRHDSRLDEEIRRLVEPLLYEGGRGKLIPLRQFWRARFGLKLDKQLDEQPANEREPARWACWRLEERGFVGETALHICFLLSTPSHMILAQRLLELFPMLVQDIYTCDEYFGESCLHMAIVNEDIRIVKWLLDRGAQVHERCLGSFFLPLDQRESRRTNAHARRWLDAEQASQVAASSAAQAKSSTAPPHRQEPSWLDNELDSAETNFEGHCYWGEFPLSFAASLGLADCYRLLLAKGADPNRRDSNGNSTLHICVITNRRDMFDLCYANGASLDQVNGQQLSVLALAAKLERVEMFFHILAIRRQISWILCQVCFQQIALQGLDSIDTRDGSFNERSLLCIVVSGHRPIETKSSDAHLRMLDGPLAELLQVKWQTSIEHKFKCFFRCYLLLLALVSLAYITRMAAGSPRAPVQLRGQLRQAQMLVECLLVCLVLVFVLLLTRRLLEQTSRAPSWRLLAEAPELAMLTFTCCLVLLCVPARLAKLERLEQLLASIIVFTLPMKLLFFCRASRSLGSFVVMIYKILVNDVLCFVIFLVIFVAGFSQSFMIIFRTHRVSVGSASQLEDTTAAPKVSSGNYFVNLFDGLISMHMMALNEFSLVVDQFDSTDFPLLSRLIFCIYTVLVSILLINVLIAMLGKTYQDISSQPNENLRQWARALLSVERMCSPESRLKMLDKYSHRVAVDQDQGQRFYNSTWALKPEQLDEINLVRELRRENKLNAASP